jgi:hypothetical protein
LLLHLKTYYISRCYYWKNREMDLSLLPEIANFIL